MTEWQDRHYGQWKEHVWVSCRRSGFPAKAHVVIEVEQVEPTVDVLARLADLCQQTRKVFARLHVRRAALLNERAPLCNLPGLWLRPRIGGDPLKDLAVALAQRQLLLQVVSLDAGEFEYSLIERTSEVVLYPAERPRLV